MFNPLIRWSILKISWRYSMIKLVKANLSLKVTIGKAICKNFLAFFAIHRVDLRVVEIGCEDSKDILLVHDDADFEILVFLKKIWTLTIFYKTILYFNHFFKPISSCTRDRFCQSSPKFCAHLVKIVIRFHGTHFLKPLIFNSYFSTIMQPNALKFIWNWLGRWKYFKKIFPWLWPGSRGAKNISIQKVF